jgi:hypothetical protein
MVSAAAVPAIGVRAALELKSAAVALPMAAKKTTANKQKQTLFTAVSFSVHGPPGAC